MLKHFKSCYSTIYVFFGLFLVLSFCFTGGGCSTRPNLGAGVADENNVAATSAININTATEGELEQLPNIGKATALRIVQYRETHGRFRRPEHLMMIQGISDKKFRKIRTMIRVE